LWLAALVALACGLLPTRAWAQPTVTRPVEDQAGVLSAEQHRALTARIEGFRAQTDVALAVLTVPNTEGIPGEDYANRAAERWTPPWRSPGDGVLYILVTADRSHYLRVGGMLRARYPEGRVRELLAAQQPTVAEGRFGAAVEGMVGRLSNDNRDVRPPPAPRVYPEAERSWIHHPMVERIGSSLLVVGIFSLLLYLAYRREHRRRTEPGYHRHGSDSSALLWHAVQWVLAWRRGRKAGPPDAPPPSPPDPSP